MSSLTEEDLVKLASEKLYDLGVKFNDLGISDKKTKKLKVVIDGKIYNFGSKSSQTWLEGASDKKRKSYQARASKILLKNGARAIDAFPSPSWLSFHVLW